MKKTILQLAFLILGVLGFAVLLDQVIDLADEIPPIVAAEDDASASMPEVLVAGEQSRPAPVEVATVRVATDAGPALQPPDAGSEGLLPAALPAGQLPDTATIAQNAPVLVAPDPGLETALPSLDVVTPLPVAADPNDIRPVLSPMRSSWVAVRAYEGQDILYFSSLLAFRCGLQSIRYGVNAAPAETELRMEPCHPELRSPNSMLNIVKFPPYLTFPVNTITHVSVELTYADGSTESISVSRQEVLQP